MLHDYFRIFFKLSTFIIGSIVKFSYYIFDQKVKVLLVKVFMGETNIVLRKNAKDEANLRIDGKQLNTYLKHLIHKTRSILCKF